MNIFKFTKQSGARALAVFALLSMVAGMMPQQAFASDHQIVICHATGGDNYSSPSPTKAQIYGDIDATTGANAHGSLEIGVHPDDIIPPFSAGNQGGQTWGDYPGKNWTTVFSNGLTGEEIYNNGGCDGVPAPTTGTITIEKTVVNDNGGTAVAGDFTFRIDGSVAALDTAITVDAGAHTVSEDAFANYTAGDWGGDCALDGSITVEAGTDYVCTITNDDDEIIVPTGTLTVVKEILDGPVATVADFSYSLNGGADTAFEVGGTNYVLEAGSSFAVTESAAAGYTVTTDGCSGTIAENTTSVCTITNTWIPTCSDNIQNQDETGVDTGGVCGNGGGGNGPEMCTVEIVSDTSAFVVERDANAVATYEHAAWTADNDTNVAGATWIWADAQVQDPTNDETYTFRNQFGFVGNVTNATLYVASDNGHVASINGGTDFSFGSSFNNLQSYDVTSEIASGNNELLVAVTNSGTANSNYTSNPAGALYRLVIEGEVTSDDDCLTDYYVEPETHLVFGYVWHDENENEEWDGYEEEEPTEESLLGWTVEITDGETTYSTTTDSDGYYYFFVPEGTWTITEVVEEGWERTTQESYEVTVPMQLQQQAQFSFVDAVMNFLIPTAHAQIPVQVGQGPFNFGNVQIPVLSCELVITSYIGNTVSLSWTSVGAVSADITNVGAVDVNGSTTVPGINQDTEFVMTVLDRQNGQATCSTDIEFHGGGGGSRGGSSTGTRPDPEVLGVSTPEPLVLGEQVDAVPTGAPNAGAGGTSMNINFGISWSALLTMSSRRHD